MWDVEIGRNENDRANYKGKEGKWKRLMRV
jgi:hypothetical protein